MPIPVPSEWLSNPPHTLLIGDGPYAHSLAFIIGAAILSPGDLVAGIEESQELGLPQVLGSLERVAFVASASQSGADLLHGHRALWQWIEKLSPDGEQHEVAILFILPDSSTASLKGSLAIGLGLENFNPATGHGVARLGDSLKSLLAEWRAVCPLDLPPLRARQAVDAARMALLKLCEAEDSNSRSEAAKALLSVFSGREYQLDLFCRPPSHQNGNFLRNWLKAVVTHTVMPDSMIEGQRPADWLVDLQRTI